MNYLIALVSDIFGFVKFFMELDEYDFSLEFGAIAMNTHFAYFDSLLLEGGLNEGQTTLALIAMDEGSIYLEDVGNEFDPAVYMDSIYSASDGMSEALGRSVHEAALTIQHQLTSSSTGVAKFAGGFAGTGGDF